MSDNNILCSSNGRYYKDAEIDRFLDSTDTDIKRYSNTYRKTRNSCESPKKNIKTLEKPKHTINKSMKMTKIIKKQKCPVPKFCDLSDSEKLKLIPLLMYLFDEKSSKSSNNNVNQWREYIWCGLFNSRIGDKILENPKCFECSKKIKDVVPFILKLEGIDKSKIDDIKLVLKGGQGNYDFDLVLTFKNGTQKKFKYEYKNHKPNKMPQLLSLYDTKTKKGSYHIWPNTPFCKYHFNNNDHGIPKIRQELLELNPPVYLPNITEEDYLWGVQQLHVPGRTSNIKNDAPRKNEKQINNITDCENALKNKTISDKRRKWIHGEKKPILKWVRYSKKKGKEDVYENVRFFQTLFDYKDDPRVPSISDKKSISHYLTTFLKNTDAVGVMLDSIYEQIRIRENEKRFIFYYNDENSWKISRPYNDTWEKPNLDNLDIIRIHNYEKLRLKTKSGNEIEFNLRWANKKGIQNPAWQMNILTSTGTKLLPEIID
jgi:hypothetical protein